MSFIHRAGLVRVLMAIALVGLAVGNHVVHGAPSQQDAQTVNMVDFAFEPRTLTVPVGTTVTWPNAGKAPHTATSDTGAFDTGNVDPGQSQSFTFDKPGTYPYYCKYHGGPNGAGMAGTIVVEAAHAQPSPAPSAPASPAPSAPGAGGATPSVKVSNQPVVNGMITVSEVIAAQDGWIAVHMFDRDGKLLLEPLAGLTQVKAGTSRDVQVKLDPSLAAGEKLMPMLHIDAGTRGTYEFPNGPDVPVMVGDQIVMMDFTIQAGAGVPAMMPNTGAGDHRLSLLADLGVLALLAGLALNVALRRRNSRR